MHMARIFGFSCALAACWSRRLAKLAEAAAMAQAQAADYEQNERAFAQGPASFVAKQAKRLTQLVEDAARIKAEYL